MRVNLTYIANLPSSSIAHTAIYTHIYATNVRIVLSSPPPLRCRSLLDTRWWRLTAHLAADPVGGPVAPKRTGLHAPAAVPYSASEEPPAPAAA